jgi:hypothetical protein
MWLELSKYRFVGPEGVIAFPGCSAAGKYEFDGLIDELLAIVRDSSVRPSQLYEQDQRFTWIADRCLILNGIQPHQVTWPQISDLLLYREFDDSVLPGYLVTINEVSRRGSASSKPLSMAEAIAHLATVTSGLTEAVQAFNNLPLDFLLEYTETLADLRRAPGSSPRKSKGFREWVRAEKEKEREARK